MRTRLPSSPFQVNECDPGEVKRFQESFWVRKRPMPAPRMSWGSWFV